MKNVSTDNIDKISPISWPVGNLYTIFVVANAQLKKKNLEKYIEMRDCALSKNKVKFYLSCVFYCNP